MSQIKVEGLRHVYSAGTPFERVAIDGISLTVADVENDNFSVSIIPHTAEQTILSIKKVGDIVNLENDIIGKYVEKLLQPQQKNENKNNITMSFLAKHGF